MGVIGQNFLIVREKIKEAAEKVDRDPFQINLCGVTKGVDVKRVEEGIAAGMTLLGENYVKEAEEKIGLLRSRPVRWHMIGHLQTNKVKDSLYLFDMIQSLDSKRLAEEINRRALQEGRKVKVLIQVKLASEPTKFGVDPEELSPLVKYIAKSLPNILIEGLMVIPPYSLDPEDSRLFYKRLREIKEGLERAGILPYPLRHLSMGMSHDFQVAIEEGATIVRIGQAVFGKRQR